MEQDRFKNNHKLYIVGMVCLVLCLGLIFLSLFILPYFIWQLNYNIPEFILTLLNMFQEDYNYSEGASKVTVWLIFFIPGVITGIISYFVSNYIDNQIYKIETRPVEEVENPPSKEVKKQIRESAGFGLKILGLMILFVVMIFLLQFIIST